MRFQSILLTAIVMASSAMASTPVQIPATQIIATARTIVAQSGPAYRVTGVLNCQAIASEVPPYGDVTQCTITVRGIQRLVPNSAEIVQQLIRLKGRTGPYFRFQAPFQATSISSEMPPYGVTESVVVFI